MASYQDFYNTHVGKAWDKYGNQWNVSYAGGSESNYAGQCVSLIKTYLYYLYGTGKVRDSYGDAIDYWRYRNSNGILDLCTVVSSPQVGDIGVSSGGSSYGHIFIYNGNNTVLNQNYAGSPKATVSPLSGMGSIYGWLRPKALVNAIDPLKQLVAETGIMEMDTDEVRARLNGPTGDVVRYYNKGDRIKYQYKYVGNGHRYIVWKEGSSYIFLAVSGSEQYGVDKWGHVVDDDTSKPSSGITDNIKNKLIEETGRATFTASEVRARKNGPNGEVVKVFNKGDYFDYNYKYIGNGHRYVVNKSGNDYTFVAVSGSETYGEDKWADIGEVPLDKPEENPKPVKPEQKPSEDVLLNGIDISEHNGDIDLKGNDFVIIRATWGTNTDKWFKRNVEKCESLKIPYGVYCYSYALNDEQAKEEAEYIINEIKGHNVQCGVWFDMEDADNYKQKNGALNERNCTSFTNIFCKILKDNGYFVGVYSTPDWFNRLVKTEYPKWFAHWGTNDGTRQQDYRGQCLLHQYTSNPLDKNVSYVPLAELASHPVKPEEKPEDVKPPENNDNSLEDKQSKFYDNWNELLEKVLKK